MAEASDATPSPGGRNVKTTESNSTGGDMAGGKIENVSATDRDVADLPTCKSRHQITELQLSMLEKSFPFYHAWLPTSMEGLEKEYYDSQSDSAESNSIVVKGLPSNLDDNGLREFFSLFGPVLNATISRGVGTVTFDEGSEGVAKVMGAQPVTVYGETVEIEMHPSGDKNGRRRPRRRRAAPFPLVVAPPNYGPLQPSPHARSSWGDAERSMAKQSSGESANKTAQALDAGRTEGNGLVSSAPPALPSQQRKASLHSLLSEPSGNSLFEDVDSSLVLDASRRRNGLLDADANCTRHFHCDNALAAWIWPTDQPESELSCSLAQGHAANAKLPLLALVSGIQADGEGSSDSEQMWRDTNLNLLHKEIEVPAKPDQPPSKKYQALHPCLAPLMSVSKCTDPSHDGDESCSSVVSVFDVTPSCRSLHELLRTEDFFVQPLFPGMEGHDLGLLSGNSSELSAPNKPSQLPWIHRNGDRDEGLCSCHKNDRNDGRRNNRYQHSSSQPNLIEEDADAEKDRHLVHFLSDLNLPKIGEGRGAAAPPPNFLRRRSPWKRFEVGSYYRADVADLRIRFLALQLFHAVSFCHSNEITLGEMLHPNNIFVQEDGWIRLAVPVVHQRGISEVSEDSNCRRDLSEVDVSTLDGRDTRREWRSIFQRSNASPTRSPRSEAERPTIIPYPGYGDTPTVQWERGQLSNLCYLMMLNAAAGRIVGGHASPPILPWVTSFASKIADLEAQDEAWRDLSKSRFRLKKGDEQLDQTFAHANPPHHVPESICELTYAIYRARCLPQEHLKRVVRGEFNPGHYPSSIQKLYEWTPDEATIEFYYPLRPSIFKSMHREMDDLALPDWCRGDPESFIEYHRRLLESEHVSRHLHLWIDLNFGEALTGNRAIGAKNLPISAVRWADGGSRLDQCQGKCHSVFAGSLTDEQQHSKHQSQFVQLFLGPHPRRHSLKSAIHSTSQKLRSALAKDKDVVKDRAQMPSNPNHRDDVHLRKQRDLSTIGAILKECYVSARVIPPPSVDKAISGLLAGTLDIRQSLKRLSRDGISAEDLLPFPQQLNDAYQILFRTQNLSVQRASSELELVDGSETRATPSTRLEQVWRLIQNPHCLKGLSSTSVGLILPTALSPLQSIDVFVENCAHAYYPLLAEKLGAYLTCLPSLIPADLIAPPLFEFLEKALAYATTNLQRCAVVVEELGKVFAGPLLQSLYLSSSGEAFIDQAATFIAQHACAPSTPSQSDSVTRFLMFFLTTLAHGDVLGPGLCCKYIVPSLVKSIERSSLSKHANTACVQALTALLPLLPADAIPILVSKPVLRHCSQLCKSASFTDGAEAYLKDLVVLLRSCLAHTNSVDIAKYYLRSNPEAMTRVFSASFEVATRNENMLSDDKPSVELLKEASALVYDVIGYSDARYFPEVFNVVEKLCYRVLNGAHSSDILDPDDEITVLPGVEEAVMIAKKAADVCGRDLVKAHCPSAAAVELRSWLGKASGNDEQQRAASPPAAVESSDVADDAQPSSSSTFQLHEDEDGDGIILEMREPKRQTEPLPSTAGDESSGDENDNRVEASASSRFQPSQSFVGYEDYSKSKRDLAWVLGLHKEETDESQVRYKWRCRMMLTTELSDKSNAVTTCMAVNRSESLLATGNDRGEVLLYDLRQHPPVSGQRKQFGRADSNSEGDPLPIRQAEFFDSDSSVLVCNGGLHLYDAETQATISSLSPENAVCHNSDNARGTTWKGDSFVGFTLLLPMGSGSGEILGDSTRAFAAISPSHLYTIDVRCSDTVADYHKLVWDDNTRAGSTRKTDHMFRRLAWNTATNLPREEFYAKRSHPGLIDDKASFDLKCITSHSDWICTGSHSGHIHCFDRRRGTLLHCWKGHTKSIEYLGAVSRHRLLSVGADKTAVLWDMTTTPPTKISSISNIPGKESTMNIASHQFRSGGLVSMPGDGDLLLCAAAGRKATFMAMPTEPGLDGQPVDVPASRVILSDHKGNRIPSSEKLGIGSIALLPCRQLVLLGCEGEIHVCL